MSRENNGIFSVIEGIIDDAPGFALRGLGLIGRGALNVTERTTDALVNVTTPTQSENPSGSILSSLRDQCAAAVQINWGGVSPATSQSQSESTYVDVAETIGTNADNGIPAFFAQNMINDVSVCAAR